jgi:anti-sigma factor RsiW
MNTKSSRCPPDDDLCSLFDGEAGSRKVRLQQHVTSCPRCEARLAVFADVRRQMLPLKQSALDPGIAEAVLLRLPRRGPGLRRFLPDWVGEQRLPQFGARVLGGVAALAAGSVLGLSLVVGGAVADRTGMSVFSAEPAWQICAGLPSCGR